MRRVHRPTFHGQPSSRPRRQGEGRTGGVSPDWGPAYRVQPFPPCLAGSIDSRRTVARFLLNAPTVDGRREEMKARRMIDGASYGPDVLKVVGQAFDEAWHEIAGNFGDDPTEIETARLKLADAVLSVASEDSRDVETLKNGA